MPATVEVLRAYRFCLDPAEAQRQALARYAGAARWGFNQRLGVLVDGHRRYLQEVAWTTYSDDVDEAGARALVKARGGVDTPSLAAQSRELTALIADHRDRAASDPEAEGAWLHTINRHAIMAGMRNADRAWSNWQSSHRGERAGARVGYPRFKKKGRARDTFSLFHDVKRPGIRLATYRRLRLPNIGEIRLHDSGKRLGRAIARGDALIQSVTVSRSGHRWYASVLVKQQQPEPGPTRRQRAAGTVGVDLGVKATAALSTGELVPNPRVKRQVAARIAKTNRALARSKKGSNRRRRLVARLGRLHHLEALERARHTHALTKRLATGWADVAVEDLHVAGMVRSARGTVDAPGRGVRAKTGLSRSILDVEPGEIRRQLDYKTGWYGSRLHVVDRWAPTSKTCSACGWVKPKLGLGERTFQCDECGLVLDRDVNAARNIAALSAAVPTEGGDAKARGGPVPEPPVGGHGAGPWKREGHLGGHRSGAIPNPSPNAPPRGKHAA
ncbi:RNA-guided endonuclease InsQ/TnpB family protein [Dietzia sp. 179-F 9C3 NHS]|uniref:RNA-guided endonuclease InsQ/TnpB family protein n=1 Tax=Dietzia sp. 179-F 9C3 NHS TaxID=3374295 RepID=UPI00387A0929